MQTAGPISRAKIIAAPSATRTVLRLVNVAVAISIPLPSIGQSNNANYKLDYGCVGAAFRPTELGESTLKSSLLATYSITFCAFTLLPASSSRGPKTAIAPLPGTTATMPPPTPLFAGRPTCQAQPPEPSYRPAIIITDSM